MVMVGRYARGQRRHSRHCKHRKHRELQRVAASWGEGGRRVAGFEGRKAGCSKGRLSHQLASRLGTPVLRGAVRCGAVRCYAATGPGEIGSEAVDGASQKGSVDCDWSSFVPPRLRAGG